MCLGVYVPLRRQETQFIPKPHPKEWEHVHSNQVRSSEEIRFLKGGWMKWLFPVSPPYPSHCLFLLYLFLDHLTHYFSCLFSASPNPWNIVFLNEDKVFSLFCSLSRTTPRTCSIFFGWINTIWGFPFRWTTFISNTISNALLQKNELSKLLFKKKKLCHFKKNSSKSHVS